MTNAGLADELALARIDLPRGLGVGLQQRFGHAISALATLATSAIPAEQTYRSATTFSALNRDSVFGERFSSELQCGWRYALGAIERTSVDTAKTSSLCRNLWSKWSRMAGAPIAELTRDPAHLDGYIALVG